MRVLTQGFEFEEDATNEVSSKGASMSYSTSTPRQTINNQGGLRSLAVSTTGAAQTCALNDLNYPLSEAYWKTSQFIQVFPATLSYKFIDSGTTNEIFRITSTSGGAFTLYVNGSSVASGTQTLLDFTYQEIEIYANIDASGQVIITIDEFEDINYSGDITGGGTNFDRIEIESNGTVFFDDMILNDTYSFLRYDGGNGSTPTTPVTTTGKSGTIIYHVGNGVEGYLVIDNTGTAFADNDSLTAGSFTGTAFGAEETANQTAPSISSYIQHLKPNDNGTTSQLTGSDGNSVNNYLLVNDSESESTYVGSGTDSQFDIYAIENIPSDAIAVNFVEAIHLSRKAGTTLNNMSNVLRTNSINYSSHTIALLTTYSPIKFPYQINIDTGGSWTISEINAIEIGPKVNT